MLFHVAQSAKKIGVLVLVLWGLWTPLLSSQERPVIIVRPFVTADGVSWPYDIARMTQQTLAELQNKDGKKYQICAEASPNQSRFYTLNGEVLQWHPGNRAERWAIGMGTGRESARIRFWLTDASGKKVFEHEDTIRAEFWGNEYADSVGQLAHPFADKIATRLAQAKLE
jgi:hypothetical protein